MDIPPVSGSTRCSTVGQCYTGLEPKKQAGFNSRLEAALELCLEYDPRGGIPRRNGALSARPKLKTLYREDDKNPLVWIALAVCEKEIEPDTPSPYAQKFREWFSSREEDPHANVLNIWYQFLIEGNAFNRDEGLTAAEKTINRFRDKLSPSEIRVVGLVFGEGIYVRNIREPDIFKLYDAENWVVFAIARKLDSKDDFQEYLRFRLHFIQAKICGQIYNYNNELTDYRQKQDDHLREAEKIRPRSGSLCTYWYLTRQDGDTSLPPPKTCR